MPHSQVQPPQGDGIFVQKIGGSKAQFGIGFVVMLKIFLGVRRDELGEHSGFLGG